MHLYRPRVGAVQHGRRFQLIFTRGAVEYDHMGNLGNLRPDPFKERCEFRIHEHDLRIAIVGHIGRFLRGQAVVQRHRQGACLARGMAAGTGQLELRPHHMTLSPGCTP